MEGKSRNAQALEMRKKNLLPPTRFVPVGPVEWALPSKTEPSFIRPTTKKLRGNIAKGLKFERAFADNMVDRFGDFYVPGPWIHYKEIGREKTRWCQPDGLLFIPRMGRIYIIETKLRHTSDAWWQLKFLYLPIVARMFPPDLWEYCLIEVTKWYDPATRFPEKITMCPDVLSVQPNEFGVHIWTQR